MADRGKVTLTWDEWIHLTERAEFAEDRLRICRTNVHARRALPWSPLKWRKMLVAVRWTLNAGGTDGPGDDG